MHELRPHPSTPLLVGNRHTHTPRERNKHRTAHPYKKEAHTHTHIHTLFGNSLFFSSQMFSHIVLEPECDRWLGRSRDPRRIQWKRPGFRLNLSVDMSLPHVCEHTFWEKNKQFLLLRPPPLLLPERQNYISQIASFVEAEVRGVESSLVPRTGPRAPQINWRSPL